MKVKFLGHASFLITSDDGVKIITDPYKPGCFDGGIKYDRITEAADIVTISHEHDDHNETDIKGNPVFVRSAEGKEIKGVGIRGIEVFHDANRGKERGNNVIFALHVDGMNVVHLGDLGHELSAQEIQRIGPVDVVFIPVGGHFTIDAQTAEKVIADLKPKVVVPMHFKTNKCGFPIASLEDFIGSKEIKKHEGEAEITKETLPASTSIYVFVPAN